MLRYAPAIQPTMYFIGVSTSGSSIMKIFPCWMEHFGTLEAILIGIDFPLHAEPAAYREAVRFIKADPLSLGALVTTHKVDVFHAARDLFDALDPYAEQLGEVSCLSKRKARLIGHAKDPISSGLALAELIPENHWERTRAEAFIMGAGGAATAISWYLNHGREAQLGRHPSRLIISDRNSSRLEEVRRLHSAKRCAANVDFLTVSGTPDHDAVLTGLTPGSLVVNATGLGKDAPGSPVSASAHFPERGIIWELNYRGDLVFLEQARAQRRAKGLQIEDGWTYFLHGWTRAIAEVFALDIPTSGAGFQELARIATEAAR